MSKLTRLALLRRALTGRCKDDGNWSFGWGRFAYSSGGPRRIAYDLSCSVVRWAYTAKTIVCIVCHFDRAIGYPRDLVEVAQWGMRPWSSMDFPGTAYDWTVLGVTHGLRRWSFDVYEVSSA